MGAVFLYHRLPILNRAAVDFSAGGDNTIIAAVAGKRILVHRLILVVSAATSIIVKRGATALTGAMSMSANGALSLDTTGEPWFTTDINENFVINLSAGVQVGGSIYYDLK